mmetsp:Transcript_11306/g.47127  ORF Transcript_11306/g.47127 Transcript_11306/m.47127 type:complete len:85 (+) Transcript_11306:174-428(+)
MVSMPRGDAQWRHAFVRGVKFSRRRNGTDEGEQQLRVGRTSEGLSAAPGVQLRYRVVSVIPIFRVSGWKYSGSEVPLERNRRSQ